MLTQFQTIETQAAVLAACPRPRALAMSVSASPVITRPAPSVPSAWSSFAQTFAVMSAHVSGLGAFAEVERPDASERPMPGYAFGIGEGRTNGNTGSTKQQDQKNLTARREPVTWRPPH
jgi:hypothetical protein